MPIRHVPWQKIKVQDPQGPASSIHFRILGSQGPASNIHFRILGSQGPMSSIHFRILGFQGPTSSIHFRIQGSQGPTSGTQFRILGSQGPMTSINFRIQSPQGPTYQSPQDPTSTHFRIQNLQDPMTSRYALQDTMFPRSHEFMAYLLQLSAFNLSPKAYHLQPWTTTYNLPPAGWVRKVVLFFYNSSFWSPIVRAHHLLSSLAQCSAWNSVLNGWGPRTLKSRDIKILRFWALGFLSFATYPNFKVLGFQGLATIKISRSWVFWVSLHIKISRSWVSKVLRQITIWCPGFPESHDKKDVQGPRSIKVPDLGLSEPRISDLFGTLAQVWYQSYVRVRSRIRDVINLTYDVIVVTLHHLWGLYALNIQPRCIKTPHSMQNYTGNTLVKVLCRYDRQFCWYGLVKLKNHRISENFTFVITVITGSNIDQGPQIIAPIASTRREQSACLFR